MEEYFCEIVCGANLVCVCVWGYLRARMWVRSRVWKQRDGWMVFRGDGGDARLAFLCFSLSGLVGHVYMAGDKFFAIL